MRVRTFMLEEFQPVTPGVCPGYMAPMFLWAWWSEGAGSVFLGGVEGAYCMN